MGKMIIGVIGIVSIFSCFFIASELEYREQQAAIKAYYKPHVEYARKHLCDDSCVSYEHLISQSQ